MSVLIEEILELLRNKSSFIVISSGVRAMLGFVDVVNVNSEKRVGEISCESRVGEICMDNKDGESAPEYIIAKQSKTAVGIKWPDHTVIVRIEKCAMLL